MGEELNLILNNKALLVMLLVPAMAVGLLIITLSYKLAVKVLDDFGKPFITAQLAQSEAFRRIAENVEATRITLSALTDKIERLENKIGDK